MTAIVEHQLRRAATSGGASVGRQAVECCRSRRICAATLLKVHGTQGFLRSKSPVAAEAAVRRRPRRPDRSAGQPHGQRREVVPPQVRVSSDRSRSGGRRPEACASWWRTTGRACLPQDRERVLERGARADEQTPGHGLGLAMVRDMVELYGGSWRSPNRRWAGPGSSFGCPGA